MATERGYWISTREVSSNKILESFVRRSVDEFNDDVPGLACLCPGYRWVSVGIVRWLLGETNVFL